MRKEPSADAPDREWIDWLIAEVREHEQRLDTVAREQEHLPERWQEDIAAVRAELTAETATAVRRLAETELPMRLVGVAYVVAGLVLTFVSTLL